jgi:DNA-directed RNA polymerase subunit K
MSDNEIEVDEIDDDNNPGEDYDENLEDQNSEKSEDDSEKELSSDEEIVESLDDAQIEGEPKLTLKKTSMIKKISKYEVTAIIGFRAQQIAEGAEIYLKSVPENSDPIDIAIEEYNQNLIPLMIERPFPSKKIGGCHYETYKLADLVNVMTIE